MPPTSPGSRPNNVTGTQPPWLSLGELMAACETPFGLEHYSPLMQWPCLLLDCSGAASAGVNVPVSDLNAVATRLRALPCPVLALEGGLPQALLPGVDVLLETRAAAQTLLRNIARHPLAAMTLVQLLRHNEHIEPQQALLAESLAYASLQGGAEFRAAQAAGLGAPQVQDAAGPALLVSRKGNQLELRLNRPHARNAYNAEMRNELFVVLQLLRADTTLKRAVVSGKGSCFSVGGDLAAFGQVADTATAHAIRSVASVPALLLELSPRLEFHLHGACIGSGIELAAFAGRVLAKENTFIQLPELRFGLLPGAGGMVSIPRRIGRQRTAWLALSGRRIRAATALEWGLVDGVVSRGQA